MHTSKMKVFLTSREKVLFGMFLSMVFISVGVLFNFMAIVENGGKMPVYISHNLGNITYEDDSHFYYDKTNEVNYKHLTDIIPFRFNGERYKASIGDVVMLLGFLSLCFFSGLYNYKLIKRKK